MTLNNTNLNKNLVKSKKKTFKTFFLYVKFIDNLNKNLFFDNTNKTSIFFFFFVHIFIYKYFDNIHINCVLCRFYYFCVY